jgi:hypothetical protein
MVESFLERTGGAILLAACVMIGSALLGAVRGAYAGARWSRQVTV